MAYNNSDDGYDLYAKSETGPIGVVTLKNCLAFRNGYTEDGRGYGDCDGNGFKLGGGGVGSAHVVENCFAFENLNCGFTDNNNPNLAKISNCTAVNNGIGNNSKPNFSVYRCTNCDFDNLMTYYNNSSIKKASDKFVGTYANGVYYNTAGYYKVTSDTSVSSGEKIGTKFDGPSDSDFISTSTGSMGTDFHKQWRNSDGSINTQGYFQTKTSGSYSSMGYRFNDDDSSNVDESSSEIDSSSKEESSSEIESSSDSSSDASSDDSSDVVVGDETVIIDNYPQFDGGTWGEKEYSFNVPTAGKYVLKLQFQGNADAYFKMKLDGVENNPWAEGNWVGDTFGGNEWSSFGTKEATVELTAGTHTITVEGNNYAKYGLCTIAPVESHTHKYTATVTKAATCTEDGVMTYTCECGDSYTEVIKATGHKFGAWTTTTAATCTEDGVQTRTCSVCGEKETRTIAATGHKYVETIVAPTTTEQGYTLHKCSVCGDEYKDNFTDPVKEPTTLSGKVASQYNTSGDLRFLAMIQTADAAGADVAYYDLKVDGKLVERVPVTKTYKSYVSNGKTQQAPAGANFIITKNLSNLKNGQKATFELYFSNFDLPLTRTITVNK